MSTIGFPEITIKVYPDYDHYSNDQYYNISNSYLKLNIRTSLSGIFNGIIIVSDTTNILDYNKDMIFVIEITNNTDLKLHRFIFGCTHTNIIVLQNGEPAKSYNLVPYHKRYGKRFAKKLTNSAEESIEILLDELYEDCPLLQPVMNIYKEDDEEYDENGNPKPKEIEEEEYITIDQDAYIPSAIWVKDFDTYMKFVTDKGFNVKNDTFVFCWYEDDTIRIVDFQSMIEQEPLEGLISDAKEVGYLSDFYYDKIPVFNFEFMTKENNFKKYEKMNASYLTTSLEKNGSYMEIIGTGENIIPIDRSCIYREMTYDNGYEEIHRYLTLSQYDSYCRFRSFGDMRIKPGAIITIEDEYNLIKYPNIIDDVVYEFSQTEFYTHVYTMCNSEDIIEFMYDQKINPEGTGYPENYLPDDNVYEYDNGEKSSKARQIIIPEGADNSHLFPYLNKDREEAPYELDGPEFTRD